MARRCREAVRGCFEQAERQYPGIRGFELELLLIGTFIGIGLTALLD
jgi:hypothetical protein